MTNHLYRLIRSYALDFDEAEPYFSDSDLQFLIEQRAYAVDGRRFVQALEVIVDYLRGIRYRVSNLTASRAALLEHRISYIQSLMFTADADEFILAVDEDVSPAPTPALTAHEGDPNAHPDIMRGAGDAVEYLQALPAMVTAEKAVIVGDTLYIGAISNAITGTLTVGSDGDDRGFVRGDYGTFDVSFVDDMYYDDDESESILRLRSFLDPGATITVGTTTFNKSQFNTSYTLQGSEYYQYEANTASNPFVDGAITLTAADMFAYWETVSLSGGGGIAGPAGPQGEQGPVGPQGEKGDTGATGPRGLQGERGEQGEQGDAGVPVNIDDVALTSPPIVITADGPAAWSSYTTLATITTTDTTPFTISFDADPDYNEAPQSGGDRILLEYEVDRTRSSVTTAVSGEVYYPRYINTWAGITDQSGYEWRHSFLWPQSDVMNGDTYTIKVRMIKQDASRTKTATYDSNNTEIQKVPLTGAVGATGPQGEQGLQGGTGPAGQDGIDGQDGARGPAGADGAQGLRGPQGIQGAQGVRGERGPTGADGPTGQRGEQGIQGIQGVQGEAGQDGGISGPYIKSADTMVFNDPTLIATFQDGTDTERLLTAQIYSDKVQVLHDSVGGDDAWDNAPSSSTVQIARGTQTTRPTLAQFQAESDWSITGTSQGPRRVNEWQMVRQLKGVPIAGFRIVTETSLGRIINDYPLHVLTPEFTDATYDYYSLEVTIATAENTRLQDFDKLSLRLGYWDDKQVQRDYVDPVIFGGTNSPTRNATTGKADFPNPPDTLSVLDRDKLRIVEDGGFVSPVTDGAVQIGGRDRRDVNHGIVTGIRNSPDVLRFVYETVPFTIAYTNVWGNVQYTGITRAGGLFPFDGYYLDVIDSDGNLRERAPLSTLIEEFAGGNVPATATHAYRPPIASVQVGDVLRITRYDKWRIDEDTFDVPDFQSKLELPIRDPNHYFTADLGITWNDVGTDVYSNIQSTGIDLDDFTNGKFSFRFPLAVSDPLVTTVGFNSGGQDKSVTLTEEVFASAILAADAYSISAGVPAGGLEVFNQEIYSTTTLIAIYYVYIARDSNNVVGLWSRYHEEAGTQTPTVTNMAEGDFDSHDTTAGSTGPTGPRGEQGPKGDDGAQGPKGDRGDTGPKGDDGQTGPRGAQGLKGDTGAAGADGQDGTNGQDGAKGDTGDTGPRGPAGQDGTDGTDGAQGPQGEQGPTGARGPMGLQGETGAKGDTGPRGEQGPAGAGGGTTEQTTTSSSGSSGTPLRPPTGTAVAIPGMTGISVTGPKFVAFALSGGDGDFNGGTVNFTLYNGSNVLSAFIAHDRSVFPPPNLVTYIRYVPSGVTETYQLRWARSNPDNQRIQLAGTPLVFTVGSV